MGKETNQEQEFDLIVWYRCVRNGEQEKDFNDYKIKAKDIQEAVNKAADMFKSFRAIPFSFEHNGQKYTPNNFDRKIFN